MTDFAKRLRTLLNKKGVSAAQLSRMTGISEAKQKQDYVKLANYIENIG